MIFIFEDKFSSSMNVCSFYSRFCAKETVLYSIFIITFVYHYKNVYIYFPIFSHIGVSIMYVYFPIN